MADAPAYVVLGRGRWAGKIRAIVAAENRRVFEMGDVRQRLGESAEAYRARLATALAASGARIAWLCVLPGPHVATMIDAALDAGLHVIVEKPWLCPASVTHSLIARARMLHRIMAIHYEYCLLDEVEKWRATFYPGAGLQFGGHFFLNRQDHTGMQPLDNLGTHLLAIHTYAVPQSTLGEIHCAYERPDERSVWLERQNARAAHIDLLAHKQPIIQQFLHRVEEAIDESNAANFPLDLDFALRVAEQVDALR